LTAIEGPSDVIGATRSVPAVGRDQAAAPLVSDYVIGLFLVAICPALFWTAVLAGAGWMLSWQTSSTTLATTGAAIAGFLAMIYAAVSTRSQAQ